MSMSIVPPPPADPIGRMFDAVPSLPTLPGFEETFSHPGSIIHEPHGWLSSSLEWVDGPQLHVAMDQSILPEPTTAGKIHFAGKKKSKKKKVDKNTVSRPMNAFMLWASKYDNRKRIREENPGLVNNEVSKLLGLEWRSLGAAGQKAFRFEAKLLKEQAYANGYTQGLLKETRAKKKFLPTVEKLFPHMDNILQSNLTEVDFSTFEAVAEAIHSEMIKENLAKAAKASKL